jgi:hypothetical protein
MTRDSIWLDIITERFRQKRLLAAGKFDRDMAAPATVLSPAEKLTVCSEEFGEVARVVCESLTHTGVRATPLDTEHLREELIQLATCCVAWVEELDGVEQEQPLYTDRELAVYASDPHQDGLAMPLAAFAVEAGAS